MVTRALIEHVAHFQRRVLVEALQDASAMFWTRRAEQFAAVGTAECDEIAEACRNRARVALLGGEFEHDVDEALR